MRRIILLLLLACASVAEGQPIETHADSLRDDARLYATQFEVSLGEALRRLHAQQASVVATDRIAREFADRLAGISIDNGRQYRIHVLLTGTDPVKARRAAGVPIVFTTGAAATHAQSLAAMQAHLIELRRELPTARGVGYDQRTGEIVLLVSPAEGQLISAIRSRAQAISQVPVRVVVNGLEESNMRVGGGEQLEGTNLITKRPNRCTSGFVVTNGEVNAIATAAHCPDQLTFAAQGEIGVILPMIGSWGAAYRDVQINGSADSPAPLFYPTGREGTAREVESWRNVASTRAGDFVCHFGISSGYSCSTVELTDYAPPGYLCGGPCSPTWVTVAGPSCEPGDSGGPVFSGNVAFGIAKGINRTDEGRCLFYYYMSTDYLPPPWRLLTRSDVTSKQSNRPAAAP